MRAETLHAIVLLAAVGGLALSVFAAYETTHPAAEAVCNINSYFSCAAVDQSAHSSTFGIPDYAFGIGGFIALLAVDIPLYRSWERSWLLGLATLSVAGVVVSVYFAYVEVAIIQAFCPVCLSAYLANAIVLAGALALWWKARGVTARAVRPEEPRAVSAP
jgi:uncharacterized membrane protein